MNIPFFIAKKVITNPSQSFSRLIIRIAIVAVALGMTVMVVSSSLISGFKNEISNKIFGFWGHIHIMNFEIVSSNAYETVPVSTDQTFYPNVEDIEKISYPAPFQFLGYKNEDWMQVKESYGGVRHIQTFAQKIGVIKTKKDIEGIILKGIGQDYDWKYLDDFMVEGERLELQDSVGTREILISEKTSKRLNLKLKDKLLVYFVKGSNQVKRLFQVKGIYKTGLDEYDAKYAIVDIREIQQINKWEGDQVSGFEIFIDDLRDIEPLADHIYDNIEDHNLYCTTIKDIEPNIFGWLELQNVNEIVILTLMILVGIINMITALIILILERTNMIGVLKALGAKNSTIQKTFLYYGAYIVIVGLFIGNIIGIGLCLIQKYAQIIKLPEEDYYVAVAPIDMNFYTILLLNVGTLVITVLILIIPSFLVRKITPVKAIRFK